MEHDYLELTDQLERAYSPRLALRQVSLADGWPLFEATRNPLFNKHLLWDPPQDEFEVLRRIDAIVEAGRRGRLSAVSCVIRTTGEWTSMFRFQPYARDPHAMEMGVWTHDRFWKGRYTQELSQMVIDATFAVSTVERLMGAAAPDNAGSCALMHSVGMSETEIVPRRTESGHMVELQEFEILREDWMLAAARRAAQPSHEMVPWPGDAALAAAQARAARRRDADHRGYVPGSAGRHPHGDTSRDQALDAVD